MRIIEIVDYCESWPARYEREVGLLQKILKENFIRAYHIGSTAIPGMKSKPIIDIVIEAHRLNDLDNKKEELSKLGYTLKGEHGIAGRRFLHKGADERSHHVHIYESGSKEIERHRLFVEFLSCHPDKAKEYQNLKQLLCSQFSDDPEGYTKGKSGYIKSIDIEAYLWKHS